MDSDQTPADAIVLLTSRPLRFGDPEQIEALEILKLAEQLVGAEWECPGCGGSGENEGKNILA